MREAVCAGNPPFFSNLLDGTSVEPAIVRAWIASCHRAKKTTPSPTTRVMSYGLDRNSAATVALAVWRAWKARDTERRPVSEARKSELRSAADNETFYGGKPAEARFAELVDQEERMASSAIADKGIFAWVAATGDRRVVEEVSEYLSAWYGWRAPQCKALLQMVGWIDDASATTLLVHVAARFRTAGIRKEAQLQLTERAARGGWTVEDLADRTMPTAGLDTRGVRELAYYADGEVTRRFEARLRDDGSLALYDPEGRPLPTLPKARATEDPTTAKRELATTSREVRQTSELLRARLFEAMAVERRWRMADWRRDWLAHPIGRRFAETLVWQRVLGGSRRGSFRPTPEGELVDPGGDVVRLDDDDELSLAHGTFLSEVDSRSWGDHLSEHALLPPFSQFRQASSVVHEGDAVSAFEGSIVGSLELGRIAKTLGYVRGPAGEGGVFDSYLRALPSRGWVMEIVHSGARLPEQSHPVALISGRVLESMERRERALSLARMPRVLLHELTADLEAVASASAGIDPTWRDHVWV